jgi:D-3-phosphoglycerate dehydrogenase
MLERAPRILISDDLNPAGLEVFRRRGLEPQFCTGLSEAELCAAVRAVDALVVRSATKVTRRVLEAAERLRVVGRAGIGVDNIDVEAATERGVVVMNTPRGNATTTAELALALVFALARHLPRADRQVRSGIWKQKGLMGTEVTGKTLGVVGLGRIGRIVAEKARGVGMKIVAYDPYLATDGPGAAVGGVELVDLDTLLARSDFVSLHVPLTPETRHLISWERLARIKPGARLIQVSRGGVVDEEAVLDALIEGRLAGAAFDVLEKEPPGPEHVFFKRDDVILTPHLGASSAEAQLRVAVDIAEQVSAFLLEGVAENAVNAPSLAADALAEFGPFLVLAEKIGSFLAQRMRGPIRKLELCVAGEVARHGLEHVRLSLLVGILRQSLEKDVNVVNAPALARERGILVLESSEKDATFRHGEISVRAAQRGGTESHLVVGTVFGREPRLVRIDDFTLDLPPKGPILITRHHDRPGVLGQIGTLLGQCGVNIQRLELGPPSGAPGGLAAGFLSLYGEPDPAVVARVAELDSIEEVQLIRL